MLEATPTMTELTTMICRGRRWSLLWTRAVGALLGCALLGLATPSRANLFGDIKDGIHDGLVDIGADVAGGFSGAIGVLGAAYVDALQDEAIGMPPAFADIIREFMNLEDFPGAFAEEDLQRVRILPASHPGAEQFVTKGHSGVTLDSLVIVTDARYEPIMNWDRSWAEVLDGEISSAERKALFLMLHELVHVRQFREMGRQAFLDEYLPAVVRDGDHGARLEEEAYRMAPRKGSWAREVLDAYSGGT
jgi:hypothetical protein